MRYARSVCLNTIELPRRTATSSHMQKHPPEAGVFEFCQMAAGRSEADGSARDGLDFRTLDAKIA